MQQHVQQEEVNCVDMVITRLLEKTPIRFDLRGHLLINDACAKKKGSVKKSQRKLSVMSAAVR